MPSRSFPQVSSLPSFRVKNEKHRREEIHMKPLEANKLRKLPSSCSKHSEDVAINSRVGWTPISISSGSSDEDEKYDKVESELRDFHRLPVVMKTQPSMLSLRFRHDQQFQGVRMLKPARFVNKAGDRNIDGINLPQKSVRFFKDIAHTLIDAQWRWVLTVFVLSYFLSWLLFAILFYIISWSHGDLQFDEETGQRLGEGSEECIRGVTSFIGFFLFSVESQVSTGFGARYPTEECAEAIFLLVVQLTIGLVVDAAMVGIVYVKMIRPQKYSDFKFSKKAVICQRDGKLCLIFRAADFKHEHSIDSKIRAYLFAEKMTAEGERTGKNQQRLKLENNGRVLLIWPQTVCHIIDKTSPFYDMSARDLIERRLEIVVSLTGSSLHTGQMTQARTSYLAKEILWGHRFTNVITYDRTEGKYVTLVEKLDDVEQIDTALCSAHRLNEIIDEVHEALDRETVNGFYFNDIEEDEESDDESYSGLHMLNKAASESMKSPQMR